MADTAQPAQHVTPQHAIRVSKRGARKLYNLDVPMIVVPCKDWPFSSAASSIDGRKSEHAEDTGRPTDFDRWINAFTFYNCTYETGYYPAFYVNERDAFAHNVTPLNLER